LKEEGTCESHSGRGALTSKWGRKELRDSKEFGNQKVLIRGMI